MFKLKSILLCSAVSASLIGLTNMAKADDASDTYGMGGYVEFGLNFGITNALGLQTKDENNLITIKRPNSSLNGAVGMRYKMLTLGLDVSHLSTPIEYRFSGKSTGQQDVSKEWGNLSFTTFIAKLSAEHNFSNNNLLYLTAGFGASVYTRDKNDKTDSEEFYPTPVLDAPAILLGFGYKRYLGNFYLSSGIKYTRMFNKKFHLEGSNHDVFLSSGIGFIQFECKLGYDF